MNAVNKCRIALGALVVGAVISAQHSSPRCSTQGSTETEGDCVKALTGCICTISQGGFAIGGLQGCEGCQYFYDYEISCTNAPGGSPGFPMSDGPIFLACGEGTTTVPLGVCPCDGVTAMVTLNLKCKPCPD